MIYIYNETNTKWETKNITDRLNKISITKSLKGNKTKHTSIVSTNEIEMPNIGNYTNMTTLERLTDKITGVYFQKKDQAPLISDKVKYNKDIFFININLNGSIIKSMTTEGVFILTYLITGNELILVASLGSKNTEGINITLHNPKTSTDKVYSITPNEGGEGYAFSTNEMACEDVIEKPQLKLIKFRPAAVTYAVFVNMADCGKCDSLLEKEHYVSAFNTIDELTEFITIVRNEGYRAVTLFIDLVKKNDPDYALAFELLKKSFTSVNILLSDNRVIKK